MKYRPLYDNLVIKLEKVSEKTQSGIILPGSSKEKPHMGEVVAMGEGKLMENGTLLPLKVKIGDKVIFKSFAPTELPNEEELVVISESDILVVIE